MNRQERFELLAVVETDYTKLSAQPINWPNTGSLTLKSLQTAAHCSNSLASLSPSERCSSGCACCSLQRARGHREDNSVHTKCRPGEGRRDSQRKAQQTQQLIADCQERESTHPRDAACRECCSSSLSSEGALSSLWRALTAHELDLIVVVRSQSTYI